MPLFSHVLSIKPLDETILGLTIRSKDTELLERSPAEYSVLGSCKLNSTFCIGTFKTPFEKEALVTFSTMDAKSAAKQLGSDFEKALTRTTPDIFAEAALVLQADYYHLAACHAKKHRKSYDRIARWHTEIHELFADNHGPETLNTLKKDWWRFKQNYATPCFIEGGPITIC